MISKTLLFMFVDKILYLLFFKITIVLPDYLTCIYLNQIFCTYFLCFYLFFLTGCLSISVMIIFGFMVFRNIRTLASSTVAECLLSRTQSLDTYVFFPLHSDDAYRILPRFLNSIVRLNKKLAMRVI